MTATLLRYLNLISIDFFDLFHSVFSLALVSIETIYQTRKIVFDHISQQTPQSSSKIVRFASFFSSFLGVWKCGKAGSRVFDIFLNQLLT